MPFRRTRRRFSGGRMRRRRFTRTRPTRETVRWETATFSIVNTITAEAGQGEIQQIELMKISEHVSDPTAATVIDDAFNNMVRFIEIGGVVFNWHIAPLANNEVDIVSYIKITKALVTFPLEGDGIPSFWDSQINMNPISVVPAGAGAQDQDMPTRIHWRNSHFYPGGDLNEIAFPTFFHRDQSGQETVNLRLRTRLDDHQGLYFYLQAAGSGAPGDPVLTYWLNGTLYYRVRL